MTTSDLRERLSAANVGQFFNICVDAIIYAERLEADLATRDELLDSAAEPMRYLLSEMVCTCHAAYRDRGLTDPSCCACEWYSELAQMQQWLDDYEETTT